MSKVIATAGCDPTGHSVSSCGSKKTRQAARRLPRLAAKLHSVLTKSTQADAATDQHLHRVRHHLDAVRRRHELATHAAAHGWDYVAGRLRAELLDQLTNLKHVLEEGRSLARSSWAIVVEPLPAHQICEELRSLQEHEELHEFTFDGRGQTLSVVTEAIVLDGLHLGPFRITLELSRLHTRADGSAFSVDALEPNPADGDESIVHPHVTGTSVCLGDATYPIQHALRQGRISDAFVLVERVLKTYNASSPYRRLEEWNSQACEDCGERGDEMSSCSRCGRSICCGCERECDGCSDWFCHNCLSTTGDGERKACRDCRGRCASCDGIELQSVLDEHEGLCDACRDEQREQADQAELESTSPVDNEVATPAATS